MAPRKSKGVIVHWKPVEDWKLGAVTFHRGPNPFTRDEYKLFEVRPLFLRQIAAGKCFVEDSEVEIDLQEPKTEEPQPIPVGTVNEGDVAEDTKKKRPRKESEGTPS